MREKIQYTDSLRLPIRDWFNAFRDKEMGKKAFEYYKQQDKEDYLDEVKTLEFAVNKIRWSDTDESEFWQEIYEKSHHVEFIATIIDFKKLGLVSVKREKNVKPIKIDHDFAFETVRYANPSLGFESTWRSHDINNTTLLKVLNTSKRFSKIKSQLKIFTTFKEDPEVVEIVTEEVGYKEIPNMIAEYQKLKRSLKRFEAIESCLKEDGDSKDGGGHIHMNLKSLFPNLNFDYNQSYEEKRVRHRFYIFYSNMVNFVINNPWLSWAMNSPGDEDGARNFLSVFNEGHSEIQKYLNTIVSNERANIDYFGLKDKAIAYRSNLQTIEFRLFRMPASAEELQFNIDFAYKIYQYIWEISEKGLMIEPLYKKKDSHRKIPYSKSYRGLTAVCLGLGVRMSEMKRFGKIQNLKDRYKYERMTDKVVDTYLT